MAAAATARRSAPAPARRAAAAPARRVRTSAPYPRTKTRSAPQPARRSGAHLIPIAVGAAGAVRQLPDSSLIVRLTRGRAWIALLGVLLTGIVAINVVTLSLAASVGHIDRDVAALQSENAVLRARDAERSGAARVRSEAGAQGLVAATSDQVGYVKTSPDDARVAAERLAAAGSGY
jgi:hypothetical protein